MILDDKSGQFHSLTTYLINLEDRPDRLEVALAQAHSAGLRVERVVAVSPGSKQISNKFLSKPAIACWESHKYAMQQFLISKEAFCIIAEDDFVVSNLKHLAKQLERVNLQEFDFLQLGYLNTGFLDRISRLMVNGESTLFLLVAAFVSRFPKVKPGISERLRVKRNSSTPRGLVVDDIRAGAHFYVVSRNFAEKVTALNDPTFLTADGLYIALAWGRCFKMARTRRTNIKQSNSPSSIKTSSYRKFVK